MKRSNPALLQRICSVPIPDQAVSVMTVAGLLYGVKLSARPKQARAAFDAFIRHLEVIEWSAEAAEHYADIRANLKLRGEMMLCAAVHGQRVANPRRCSMPRFL